MPWYKTGTVTVTNGSPTVTGSGTDWIANAAKGEGFMGPDGKIYEILTIVSAASITLASNYIGAPVSGAAYTIVPTQGYLRDLASQCAALIAAFSGASAEVLAGRFGDGAAATPGISFTSDQDTGFYRAGANSFAAVTSGIARTVWDASGNVGFGTSAPDSSPGYTIVTVNGPSGSYTGYKAGGAIAGRIGAEASYVSVEAVGARSMRFSTNGNERGRFAENTPSLLVGATTSSLSDAGRGLVSINGTTSSICNLARGNAADFYLHNSASSAELWNTANTPLIFGVNNAEAGRFETSGNLVLQSRVLTPAAIGAIPISAAGTLVLNLEAISGVLTAGLLTIRGNENGINQTIAVYSYNVAYGGGSGIRYVRLQQISRNSIGNGFGDVYAYLSGYSGSITTADQSASGAATAVCDIYFRNSADAGCVANYSITRLV